jgi:hypothetical protein
VLDSSEVLAYVGVIIFNKKDFMKVLFIVGT